MASPSPVSLAPDPTCTATLASICHQASLVLCLVADTFAYVSCFLTHHSCSELAPGECMLCVYLEIAKIRTGVPWEGPGMQTPGLLG